MKIALIPDRERVDRFFAGEITDGGVHHLTVLEKNVAAIVVAGQGKFARFSGNTDQLDDVRKRQFFERSLESHLSLIGRQKEASSKGKLAIPKRQAVEST